ncbi:VWA domain-containing protein [Nocardioides sp. Soil805]|uniref:VWA domain-containing protein n=1 Tax=Nocardioides sp. Soil805 TaxID=1736416 RepID=UPI0007037C61|nr:VWA domain-containing protein [Nocardioides sp. Soil805]KRF35391.1 hypothetical protein ASG94_14950 [Nocardioides sp. Soil805]
MDTQEDDAQSRKGSVGPVGLAVLLTLALLAGAGLSFVLWSDKDVGVPFADAGCERSRTVELTVAPQLREVVSRAVADVAPACTRVDTTQATGGQVALAASTGASLPDIWIADGRLWMTPTYLGTAAGLRMVAPSIARTPVLLVGGPMAQQFDSWGAAEASGLVSVPDPLTSTVGSLAVVAPRAEAAWTGRSPAQAQQMTVSFAQQYGERRARGMDEDVQPGAVVTVHGSVRDPISSRRLVVATEQELAQARAEAAYLRDLTPGPGALALDFPMAVRQQAAPGSGVVARRLVAWFDGEEGMQALHDAGLRGPDGVPAADAAAEVSRYLPTPSPRVVATAVQTWRTLSVPSAILAVVDASGSMDYAAAGATRMEVLAEAAELGLSFLPGHARVGLWIFSIDKGGPGQDWRVLEPVRALDAARSVGTQRSALRERAQQLPDLTGGGTGLYDTALAAYRQALRDYRPGFANAVVLMTDGENEDPGSVSMADLVRRLHDLRDPERPVRIVGIAISGDADLGALRRMADATGGEAYLAEQPEDILGVFAQAVLSR